MTNHKYLQMMLFNKPLAFLTPLLLASALSFAQPTAPTTLVATVSSSSQINLTWVDASNNEVDFQIERSLTTGTGFTLVTNMPANAVAYSDAPLSAGTQYFYRIRARNAGGNSAYSAEANATTTVAPPTAPTTLAATMASSSQINLTWVDASSNETGFQIQRSLTTGTGFTLVATTAANATSYSNTGLTDGTQYFYRIRSINAGGNSSYTSEANATTAVAPPAAPTTLASSAASSTQINLTWNDNSANETGFEIERSSTSGSGFSLLTTTTANAISYSNTGLTPSTQYFYRIRATNSAGTSAYTAETNVTTLVAPPAAPTTLVATVSSSSQINLTWVDASSNETDFQIERSLTTGTGFSLVTNMPANTNAYSDGSLTGSTQYFYRVRARNAGGNSAYSAEATATTTSSAPTAPSRLGAVSASSSTILLNWSDNASNETGFQIERSLNSNTGFTLIATTAANAVSYSNGSLTAGTTYYYRVRAVSGGGSSTYTNEANAQVAQLGYKRFLLDFGGPSTQTGATGWNNVVDVVAGTTVSLVEAAGTATALSFEVISEPGNNYGGGGDYNSAGYFGQVADYPSSACNDSHFAYAGGGTYRLNGLNNNRTYSIRIFGSRMQVADARQGSFTINGQQKTLEAANNTSQTIAFNNITPTAGAITLNFNVSAGSTFGYIGVMDILENPIGPLEPSALVATAVSSTTVNLTWADNSANETGFQIERSLQTGTGFTLVATAAANATSYSDASLAASTPYFYRIRAINAAGNSDYSSQVTATTATVPAVPTALVAAAISTTQINLTWADNANNETGFQIERSVGDNLNFTLLTTTVANITSYSNTGLTAGTMYYYKVRAVNAVDASGFTASASATTTPTAPADPTTLSASAGPSLEINLAWTDNSNNETGFQIERSVNDNLNFTLLTTAAANATSYSNTGLTLGTTYHYRVRALNTGGTSGYTSPVSATATIAIPAAPTVLSASGVSSTQINLAWTDNSSNETGFQIERSPNNASNFTLLTTTAANSASYSNTGLTVGTTYYYRVRAINAGGNSLFTNAASATPINQGSVPDIIEFQALRDFENAAIIPPGGVGIPAAWNLNSLPETTPIASLSTFQGIIVENGDVTDIALSDVGLTGTISSSIGNLAALKTLAIDANYLTGSLPLTIENLHNLEILDVSYNQLSGAVPAEITSLNLLKIIRLHNNQFTSIPDFQSTIPGLDFDQPSTVQILSIANNYLSFAEIWKNIHYRFVNHFEGSAINGYEYKPQSEKTESLQINSGKTIIVNSRAGGFGTTYQWKKWNGTDELNPANWIDLPGETSPDLTINVADPSYAENRYRCVMNSPQVQDLTISSVFIIESVGDYPLPPPTSFQAQVTPESINLTWSYTGTIATGFEIERSISDNTHFEVLATVDVNDVSFEDGGTEGTKYYYRIRAVNESGTSAYAAEANVTVIPSQPSNLSATAASATTVKLAWNNNSVSTSFDIERSLTPSGYTLVATTNVNATSFTDTGLTADTHYYYRIRASSGGSYSEYANVAEVTTMTIAQGNLNNWAFQYRYDGRKRMIAKKVPGAEWVYMVYDDRDRLVMTQDGEQRKSNKWSYTKYDVFNRPIITGIYTHSGAIDQAAMNDLVTASMGTSGSTSATHFFETFNVALADSHGYTKTVFSTADFVQENFEVLTVTYYDDYRFKELFNNEEYDYQTILSGAQSSVPGADPQEPTYNVVGMTTGTMVKVLNSFESPYFLRSVNYYDFKYRLGQRVSDNHLGGKDRISNLYDFSGKVLASKTVNGGNLYSGDIFRTFVYDHANRLVKTFHSLIGGPDVLIVQNEYNELGQLVTKNLHNTDGIDAPDGNRQYKQSIDYRYNIRGWLSSVNDAVTPTPGDLFSMNLNYNNPTANGGAAQFNGNISEILWRGPDAHRNSYGYSYDPMNRLVEAKYFNATNPLKDNRFNEKIWDEVNNRSGYDLNGNIKFLSRKGKIGETNLGVTDFGAMDNLTYAYEGNQLLKVDDSAVKTEGFKEGTTTGMDYNYDANGNMVIDKNKDISTTGITYNHLNLPELVIKSNHEFIHYSYDATGRKLRQEVYDVMGELKKKTDYAGEYFYENDTLKFINHEEGRITMTDGMPEYQYHLKDHLGNVRLTFTTKEETEEETATMEEVNAPIEQGQFLYFNQARKINSRLFDHTHNGTTPPIEGAFATRLTGTDKEKIGLAKSLSVMPGDKIDVEVYAKYMDASATNDGVLVDMLTAIASAGTVPAGTVIDGAGYATAGTATYPFTGYLDYTDNGTGPKAYLNYLVFDRDFVYKTGGFKQVTSDAAERGDLDGHSGLGYEGNNHERLSFDGPDQITITEAGYVYIWLSNEQPAGAPVEVYFDDFKVTQTKSPVIESQDYYPFGLTFNSYQRENSVLNKFKFQGQEHIADLGLNWDSFKWRNHQPDIGRFFNVDPLAEKYLYNSPYAFSENKVISHVELEGKEGLEFMYAFIDRVNAFNASLSNPMPAIVRSAAGTSTMEPKSRETNNEGIVSGNTLARINDGKTGTDDIAKNGKLIANETAKGVVVVGKIGVLASGGGAAALVGEVALTAVDELRQVKLENKSGWDAASSGATTAAIDLATAGWGSAAKDMITEGPEKVINDQVVEVITTGFNSVTNWAADKIRKWNSEKPKPPAVYQAK